STTCIHVAEQGRNTTIASDGLDQVSPVRNQSSVPYHDPGDKHYREEDREQLVAFEQPQVIDERLERKNGRIAFLLSDVHVLAEKCEEAGQIGKVPNPCDEKREEKRNHQMEPAILVVQHAIA